jgi:hypothetical protein
MKPTLSDLSDAQLSRELVTWQEIALQSDCKRVAAEGDQQTAMEAGRRHSGRAAHS